MDPESESWCSAVPREFSAAQTASATRAILIATAALVVFALVAHATTVSTIVDEPRRFAPRSLRRHRRHGRRQGHRRYLLHPARPLPPRRRRRRMGAQRALRRLSAPPRVRPAATPAAGKASAPSGRARAHCTTSASTRPGGTPTSWSGTRPRAGGPRAEGPPARPPSRLPLIHQLPARRRKGRRPAIDPDRLQPLEGPVPSPQERTTT